MPIICLMVSGLGKPQKMVREKSGNFVIAHGWTPCRSLDQLCDLTHNLGLGFSRSNFQIAIFQE